MNVKNEKKLIVRECANHIIPQTGAQNWSHHLRSAAKLRSLPLINKVENIATNIAIDGNIQII